MVVLKDKITGVLPLKDLKDGQIAEIIKFKNHPIHQGEIIQRYKNLIIKIGKDSDHSWDNLYESQFMDRGEVIYVRVLKEGEALIVSKNI